MFQLPFEKLVVFRLAGDLLVECHGINRKLPRGSARLKDQLFRAALSVLLNIGEGAGEWAPGDKAHFYRIALRSVTECVACFVAIDRLEWLDPAELMRAREIACQLYAMLTNLIRSVESRHTA